MRGRGGKPLTPNGVRARLKKRAQEQGVWKRVYPHLMRHSCASHLLESSGDLRAVQELLGHADIGTTQIYTHLDFQHLAKVYDAAHPRARRKASADSRGQPRRGTRLSFEKRTHARIGAITNARSHRRPFSR